MSKRYDEWFKLQVAQQCLHDGTSLREVARQHGLDHSLVRTWRESYRQHGVEGLRKSYTHRSAGFKLQVLETMWREGLSRRQTEALFDIRERGAIGRWADQYHSGGLTALEPKRKGRPLMTKKPSSPLSDDERSHKELLEELAYLRAENAYLKKLDALIREQEAATRGKKPRPSKD